MSYDYLIAICMVLLSTKVFGLITGRLHMPQVVGALLAGLIMGPAMLNLIQPSELFDQLSELGVIVMMFCAGMETSVDELKAAGKTSFMVALLGVLLPLGMGTALMMAFNPTGPMLENVFVGTVLTATSVSITVEALKELGRFSTKVGNTILAAAVIDDVLGLICLTVVTSLGGQGGNIGLVLLKVVLFFLCAMVLAFLAYHFFLWCEKKLDDRKLNYFPIAAFALCLLMAWGAEELFGVADIIGAFFAGLIISTTNKGEYITSRCAPLSYLLLTPIFFANIGLSVTLPAMSGSLLLFTVLLILVGISSKLVGCGIGARYFGGFEKKQAVQVGIGMVCRGEVALIVANKGMAMGVVPAEYFSPIVIMVIVCTVLTPVLLKVAFKGDSPYEGLEVSTLAEKMVMREQLDMVAQQLITKEKARRNKQ
ncbi:cation:proton antiporter [Bengtsoniella intestinalis]|uniref:cation:proton antiporter n=1 Tax=Bengtsoniella intestinalis TaxID=3073143 RepID=UPI00391F7528